MYSFDIHRFKIKPLSAHKKNEAVANSLSFATALRGFRKIVQNGRNEGAQPPPAAKFDHFVSSILSMLAILTQIMNILQASTSSFSDGNDGAILIFESCGSFPYG